MIAEVFSIQRLQKCTTEEEVEQYFKSVGYAEYSQKIDALTQATRSSEIEFFEQEVSEQITYKTILAMFLDLEFRFLRGIY